MTITLAVTLRDESKTLDAVRTAGEVPAVVYGPKQEPLAITVSAKEFDKVRQQAGESTIVSLDGLPESIEVLIKDIEFNPVKQQVLHVDFYAIERGKDMTVHVPIHFIGEAPVEETRQGTVTKVLHEIEVTCRPSKLPSHFDVDISVLVSVEDKIHVSDLKLPEGVVVEADLEDPIAVVSATRQGPSEDEEDAAAAVDMDAIEVEKKGKEDAEEKAE